MFACGKETESRIGKHVFEAGSRAGGGVDNHVYILMLYFLSDLVLCTANSFLTKKLTALS